ncbi:MAG TPA: PAS domain S-box protein, partial [Candidatus Paceibacterota bacterium]|nr:PAS domain S-box protein [Candidatus Paceibacterota bacterium]
ERKRAEQSIVLLSFALNNVREAAFLIGQDAQFHYVNSEACRALGYSEAELLRLGVADLDPGFPIDRWAEHWNELKTGKSLSFESRHRRKDGRTFPVEISANYFEYNGQGYNLALVRDISERQQAGMALHESEKKYRELIEKLQVAVVVHRADTQIVSCNPVAETLLGLSEEQLLGKNAVDPEWNFFGDGGTVLPPEEYPVNRVLTTRKPVRNQIVGVHRPGAAGDIWALVNANPVFDGNNRISQIIVTFVDITERRKAEEKLAHLAGIVESSEDAIIGKDLDERILSWNRGAERIYGYAAGEIVGRSIATLLPPEREHELDEIMEAVKRGIGIEHLETTRQRKDGQIIHVALTISPIRNVSGKIVGASTIARNITERKRWEEALRESQALYYSLVEQLPAGVFRKDAAGRYVYVNPWFCRLKGVNASAFLGKTPEESALTERAANGPNIAQIAQLTTQAMNHHRQIMETGKSIEIEEYGFGPDGSRQHLSVLKTPIFAPDGKVVGSQGIMFDITERKRAEEALRVANLYNRTLIEASLDPLVTIGADGRITDV